MLFYAGGNRKNVRIEDDVFSGESHFVDQQMIAPRAYFLTPDEVVCLPLLVKSHDDNRCAIFQAKPGLLDELCLARFQADGVHDTLTLNALQAGLNDFPFRRVNHDGDSTYVWLGGDEVEEFDHGSF